MTGTLEHCLGGLPEDGLCLLLLGQQRSWLTFPPGVAEIQIFFFENIYIFLQFLGPVFGTIFWVHFMTPGSGFGAVFGYQNWCQGIP